MASRKLNRKHRPKLFDFAVTKFVDKKLRKAEDAAGKAFALSLIEDYERSIAQFAQVFEIMGSGRPQKTCSIPSEIPVKADAKSFERPDGKKVVREAKIVGLKAASDRSLDTSYDECINLFVFHGENHPRRPGYGRSMRGHINNVPLPRPINLPGSLSLDYSQLHSSKTTEWFLKVQGHEATWVSQKTIDLLEPFYRAGIARADSENEMWRAIGKIIMTATTFEQVLEYWPEAKLIESELFPVRVVVNPLAPISSEEKAKLCENMSSRGVEAAACKIAA